ncbi:MAG: hypothetical protein FWE53_01265 [Firmicutes bacterium]|nr:hypothetical protein [Bacillota bacterium]
MDNAQISKQAEILNKAIGESYDNIAKFLVRLDKKVKTDTKLLGYMLSKIKPAFDTLLEHFTGATFDILASDLSENKISAKIKRIEDDFKLKFDKSVVEGFSKKLVAHTCSKKGWNTAEEQKAFSDQVDTAIMQTGTTTLSQHKTSMNEFLTQIAREPAFITKCDLPTARAAPDNVIKMKDTSAATEKAAA